MSRTIVQEVGLKCLLLVPILDDGSKEDGQWVVVMLTMNLTINIPAFM
jgi:hypothetical protein